jgi:hypothetical protein
MSKQAAVPAQPQVTPVASGGLLQRACACGQHSGGGAECESCKRKRQSQAGGLQVQFSATSRQPASSTRLDRETLPDFSRIPAHRMPNSIQARGGLGRRVAEDEDVATGSGQLAAATPNPPVVARQLTPQEMQEAITYNRYRFKDPYSLRVIRQRLGIAPVPAVVDEDFVRSIVQWQADHGLDQDGKVGPGTTASLTGDLTAAGQADDALQLRLDNFARGATTLGPTYTDCSAAQPRFNWEVAWNTSLRGGFIIQRIDNTWNGTRCNGTAMPVGSTPRYWEAWRVDNAGNVTPQAGGHNDEWTREFPGGTRGTWRETGTLYTVLNLPPAARFAANSVPDAGILQATTTAPAGDDLGQAQGRRTAAGEWDCCDPNPANWFHRPIV